MDKAIGGKLAQPIASPEIAKSAPGSSSEVQGSALGARNSNPAQANPPKSADRKKRSRWRAIVYGLLVLVVIGCCARAMLPWGVRWYVNRALDRSIQYEGRIGDITISLWRGAYSISDIRLIKKTGNVPTPLLYAKRLELAVQWNAILHGKMVGKVVMDQPELNFVDGSDINESQTGAGGPWMRMLEDLFPFKINSAEIHQGAIHFRSYRAAAPIDVYLSDLEASVDDLTNIKNQTTPLLTTVNATALAMGQAKFEFHMKMDPFSYRPTFQLAVRLLGLDVTQTNDLSRAYGQFYFKRGWFDLVIEAQAREGQLEGDIKPLFRNLQVFDLVDDIKHDDNPVQFFWQALLGITTEIFKNQSRDQFGTLIAFTGDPDQPQTDILATIGNVLRNAFIRAYLPRLENGTLGRDGLQFQPGSITDPTSVGDQP